MRRWGRYAGRERLEERRLLPWTKWEGLLRKSSGRWVGRRGFRRFSLRRERAETCSPFLRRAISFSHFPKRGGKWFLSKKECP